MPMHTRERERVAGVSNPQIPTVCGPTSHLPPIFETNLLPIVTTNLPPIVTTNLPPIVKTNLPPIVTTNLPPPPIVSTNLPPIVATNLPPIVTTNFPLPATPAHIMDFSADLNEIGLLFISDVTPPPPTPCHAS